MKRLWKIAVGVLVALAALYVFGIVLALGLFLVKFSGVQNIETWNPVYRERAEAMLGVVLPETLEWKGYRERHSFRDLVLYGEFLATGEELSTVFPPETYVWKEISHKAISPDFPDIPDLPNAQYQYCEQENWMILTQQTPDSEKIRLWFIRFY
ncbi:MAG: hypothetical protein Q4D98_14200 [Planctomycetia bacterium]|nr:hypothetical protein [Planctomycetia bacterium]